MKRKVKFPIYLLGAVLLLTVVALVCRFQSRRQASVKVETANLLPKLKMEEVAEFRLSWRTASATLKKQNGVWMVAERNLPADPAKIAAFLEAIGSIRPLKRITPVDEKTMLRLRTFAEGFDNAVPGVRVVLKNSGGSSLLDLVMGRGHFLPDDTTPPDQRVPSGRYFAIPGNDGKPVVFLAPSVFEDFHPVPGAWVKHPVFEQIAGATEIVWRSLPSGKVIWSISRSNPRLAFQDASGKRKISNQAVSSLLSGLSYRYTQDAFPLSHYTDRMPPFGELAVTDCFGVRRSLIFHRLKKDPSKVVVQLRAAVIGRPSVKGGDPAGMVRRFLSAGKSIGFEMPSQVFEILTAPPFETPRKTVQPGK